MVTEDEYFVGSVQAIFFQNQTNFYKVMLIKVSKTNTAYRDKEIVVTGSFGEIQEDDTYRFSGHLVDHPRYGQQFQVDSYQQDKPTSKQGLVAYLSSSKFPGVGKKTAERIVDTLGEGAIDLIVKDASCLEKVPNLPSKKQNELAEALRQNYGMEQIILSLNQYGFGNQLAFNIYQNYKGETLEILTEDPYRLAEEIDGIGFKKADQLAEQIGIKADAPKRIQAAIIHEITIMSLEGGHTYVEAKELLNKAIQTLEASRPVELTAEQVADEVINLVTEGRIMQDETKLYEKSLYFSEWGIATSCDRLLSGSFKPNYKSTEIDKVISLIESKMKIKYGGSQVKAIKSALLSPMFILTGGPGTGKTTIIKGIVSVYAELNGLSLDPTDYKDKIFPIQLAAPTGRAAKRMNETTGLPASTIHRLLGLSIGGNSAAPTKELEGSLLIVDEMSMVDTWLANSLLKEIPVDMQVILVGDKDQLPSVGPGQVLNDLLQVNKIPKCELNKIYRQGDDSSIIPLAHAVKDGHLPADFSKNQRDRSYFPCYSSQIENIIRQVVTRAKAKGFSAQDIQVLAPMYRGVAGIDALNKMLQEIFNSNANGDRKEVQWNDNIYRIGDKVLQLVNEPELNVFNGDMGVITSIQYAKENDDKVDELWIQFDGGEVSYRRNEWNKITLAYCCSIHKSQGSEFKMVILPMVNQYGRMLQRNLLYTAITRSKELLILLGEESAFSKSVMELGHERQTTLIERLGQTDELTPAERLAVNDYELAQTVTAEPEKADTKDIKPELNNETELEVSEISLFEDTIKQEEFNNGILTSELVDELRIDPMIGMDDITPYIQG